MTLSEIDKVLSPYAEKSYQKYYDEYMKNIFDLQQKWIIDNYYGFYDSICELADKYAIEKVKRDFEQGFQSWEYRFNTVGSSRGDYPFIAVSFGIGQNKFERMATETILKVRMNGQGKEGFKKPVLFPKLTFIYDNNLHGDNRPLEYLFDLALECSSKTMYPDFLSVTGKGYIPSIYKRYGKVISLMGCRASLSPYYVKGGMNPLNETDEPVFVGRFNCGAITLHLPMILAKSREENKDFYEVLDYYLEMIRNIHKRTYDYLGEMKASTNPLGFTQGGFYGGTLKPNDKIKPLLKAMTFSFGTTALNELQQLYNGKSIIEDGSFALEVMKYINDKLEYYKHEDGLLYASYATPAESLCFTGDTLVQTHNGCKQIKDITTDDLVYSFNEKEHKVELKQVLASTKTKTNAQIVKVLFDNGQIVRCTPNHKFAIKKANNKDIEWLMAKDLKPDDIVQSNYMCNLSDKICKVTSVIELDYTEDVYDIEVKDNHNFFVGGSNGILVHNCGLQITQFRKKYGIIKNVSDRAYVSNSFHCGVWEDISPIQKQDYEERFWDYFNGGKIQYCRYPISYNHEAQKAIVKRAMVKGFYEGCNLALSYCEECGYQQLEMDRCPKCSSELITKIDRMNGYLGFTKIHGKSRYNEAKVIEINERKSM